MNTKQIKQWAHAHPVKLAALSAFTAVNATFLAFRDDLFWPGVVLFAAAMLLAWISIAFDIKKLSLGLAVLLAAGQHQASGEEPTAEAAQAGCVVVVLVVGGVVIYSVVKFCQRHFPPPPPGQGTNGFHFAASGEDSSAASLNYSSCGSCLTPTLLQGNPLHPIPHTFHVEGKVVEQDGQAVAIFERARLTPDPGKELSWFEWSAELRKHGIQVQEHGTGQSFYGLNGQPATAADVPISFTEHNEVIVDSGTGVRGTVVVQRSEDLVNWSTASTLHLSAGYKFKFVDTSLAGQAFYRVVTQ